MTYRPSRPVFVSLAACAAALVVLLCAAHARAEGKLGVDVEASVPTSVPNADTGPGAGLRLGNKWDLLLLSLTPEISASYRAFGGTSNAKAFALVGGGRLGLDLGLEPSIFAHAGIGHYWYHNSSYESHTSLAYDLGLALDLTIVPKIDVGAHVMLAGIAGNSQRDPFSWTAVGGHIAFALDK